MQIWAMKAKVIIKFHTEFYQPVKLAQICVMTTRPVQSLPSLLSRLLSSICAIFWWGFSIWTQLKSWQGGGSIWRRRNQTAEPGTHEALLGMEASWDHVSSNWLHGCALFIQPKRMFPFTTVSYICSLCMGRSCSFKMRHLICLNMSGQGLKVHIGGKPPISDLPERPRSWKHMGSTAPLGSTSSHCPISAPVQTEEQ